MSVSSEPSSPYQISDIPEYMKYSVDDIGRIRPTHPERWVWNDKWNNADSFDDCLSSLMEQERTRMCRIFDVDYLINNYDWNNKTHRAAIDAIIRGIWNFDELKAARYLTYYDGFYIASNMNPFGSVRAFSWRDEIFLNVRPDIFHRLVDGGGFTPPVNPAESSVICDFGSFSNCLLALHMAIRVGELDKGTRYPLDWWMDFWRVRGIPVLMAECRKEMDRLNAAAAARDDRTRGVIVSGAAETGLMRPPQKMLGESASASRQDGGLTLGEQCEKMIQDAKNGIVTPEMKRVVDGYKEMTNLRRPSFLHPKDYNIEGIHSVGGAQWDYIYGFLAKNFGYTPEEIDKFTIPDIEPLFRFLENSSKVDESNASMPGPKPGREPAGREMCERAIVLLEGGRFPRGRGRLAKIARELSERFEHQPNSIEKQIRPTVKEWEKKNPDK